jgi:type IV pilus assembly protein PilV
MKARGFSLVEVMVALIIVSVGLLGIAKMQALALESTGTARLRSLAAVEAASLASMMHADRAYWAVGASTVTVTGTKISDATLATVKSCTGSGGVRPSACTPVQMAAEDLQQWASVLQALFPNDVATLTCQAPAALPVTCTIQIQWSEHSVNINKQESTGGAATAALTTYILSVEP